MSEGRPLPPARTAFFCAISPDLARSNPGYFFGSKLLLGQPSYPQLWRYLRKLAGPLTQLILIHLGTRAGFRRGSVLSESDAALVRKQLRPTGARLNKKRSNKRWHSQSTTILKSARSP